MKFYYRSSINEEDKFTIWQNGLKERLHLTESLFLKNSSAGIVYWSFLRYVSLFRFLIIHSIPLPLRLFSVFFLEDKKSAPDVFSGCSFIPCAHFKTSSVMLSYDISSRWSSHFGVKRHVFQLFSTVKVNIVAKILQSTYLCVIFHVKLKK